MSNQNVVLNGKTTKNENVRMSQQNSFKKRKNEQLLSPDGMDVLKRK